MLIAVGRCLRHAGGTGHATCAADIFEDHWLAQKFGEARREHSSQDIARAASAERIHHGHRPRWCAVAGAIAATRAVTATIILVVSMIPPTLSIQLHCYRKRRIASIIIIALVPPKTAAKNVSSWAHARPQQKAARRESAVSSRRPDSISTLLPSRGRKRNVTLEIPQPVCACRLRCTLGGHSWFGHPHREHPRYPEKKEIEGQKDDQAHL
jgi:hypothetical protein